MHKYEYKLCNGLLGKHQAPSWLAEYLKGSADSSMLSFEYKKKLHRNNKYVNTEKYNNTQGCSPKQAGRYIKETLKIKSRNMCSL